MSSPDIYTNQIKNTLVIAPTDDGCFSALSEKRNVAFKRDGDQVTKGLTRWVFANLETNTLVDRWGNDYNHEAHSLLCGSLEEGKKLLEELHEAGAVIVDHDDFFVPFQTLEITNQSTSDELRNHHPRAFALSRRDRPSIVELRTILRDSTAI
jgi:hypothetical protein